MFFSIELLTVICRARSPRQILMPALYGSLKGAENASMESQVAHVHRGRPPLRQGQQEVYLKDQVI